MQPRPYQQQAVDAAYKALYERNDNPCAVMPTGSGKSPVMAWLIQRVMADYQPARIIVLAHVSELVEQNAQKMLAIWNNAPVGIYAAKLRKRDTQKQITFASIDSVYRRVHDFEPFDIIIIDEAHRIPVRGDGKYRTFIKQAKMMNPSLRVIGVTATPYQMGVGNICHKNHILNHICYEAHIRDLIDDGYLCKLSSKEGDYQPDLSGVKKRCGDFITKDLSAAVDQQDIVARAVAEAVRRLEGRKSIIFFCIDVAHCNHVSAELAKHGIEAPVVTGETPADKRKHYADMFKQGKVCGLCNVNVYTEGFDATCCDAVVVFRPTNSKNLWAQMVGRGFRLHPGKKNCLVLDFGGNIDRLGPIDLMGTEKIILQKCHECDEKFSRAVKVCPDCGWEIPKKIIERAEAQEERERQLHRAKASTRSIISEPETLAVDSVNVARHVKAGHPDSLRVTYRCGISPFREWVCLDHQGYAGNKAKQWWFKRFGDPVPTVNEALTDIFLATKINDVTENITVEQKGKYTEITHIKLFEKSAIGHAQ